VQLWRVASSRSSENKSWASLVASVRSSANRKRPPPGRTWDPLRLIVYSLADPNNRVSFEAQRPHSALRKDIRWVMPADRKLHLPGSRVQDAYR
jgi:hypothetical protein